jgi:hypothetical protein
MLSADKAPLGFALASNRQAIDVTGLVYRPATRDRDACWDRPKVGENLIGATVHDLWPDVMAYALPIRAGA